MILLLQTYLVRPPNPGLQKVDFTREPIIETIITPKEGCKLVVRSSKNSGQDEYFVDAVEVVSFGYSFFFRSLERPKSFLVPSSDYEILEVREARMVLKNIGVDRSIKIGGGREVSSKPMKEVPSEKYDFEASTPSEMDPPEEPSPKQTVENPIEAGRLEKKRERRRHYRRRRGRDETGLKDSEDSIVENNNLEEGKLLESTEDNRENKKSVSDSQIPTSVIFSTLLPPPPTLISETIARYKDNAMFKGAFFSKEEKEEANQEEIELISQLDQDTEPLFSSNEDLETRLVEEPLFSDSMSSFEVEETHSDEISHLNSESNEDSEESIKKNNESI